VTELERIRLVRQTTCLTAGYLTATALLIITRGRTLDDWAWIAAAHLAAGAALIAIAFREPLPRILVVLRDWHPLALFPLLYKEVELLARSMGDWRLTTEIPSSRLRCSVANQAST
jgi:hypothetical protein